MFRNPLLLFILSQFFIVPIFSQEDNSRRDPTTLNPDRLPGYEVEQSPNKSEPNADTTKKPNNSTAISGPEKLKPGFTEGAYYLEIKGGASLFIDGPVLNNLTKTLRNTGFDTTYTYTYGTNEQKALLYSGIQSYNGIEVKGSKIGFLYEKAISDHWALGGGIDYREYRVNHIPNNFLSRSLIIGTARFPNITPPTQDAIARNIGYELSGLGSYSDSIVSNRIIFLEVNASYHFLKESTFDPYLRPIVGLGYDSTTKGFAGKLGGAGGMRYFFGDGFFFGGEISADIVYVGQDKIITSKAKDKFYETSYAFSFGKKFN